MDQTHGGGRLPWKHHYPRLQYTSVRPGNHSELGSLCPGKSISTSGLRLQWPCSLFGTILPYVLAASVSRKALHTHPSLWHVPHRGSISLLAGICFRTLQTFVESVAYYACYKATCSHPASKIQLAILYIRFTIRKLCQKHGERDSGEATSLSNQNIHRSHLYHFLRMANTWQGKRF